jgi:hypothetical protein
MMRISHSSVKADFPLRAKSMATCSAVCMIDSRVCAYLTHVQKSIPESLTIEIFKISRYD